METKMNPVNWFEIPVAELDRAKKFYENVFGFELALNENGGKTLNPQKSIGEHGFVAHFEDCEGNRIAIHSM